MSTPPLPYNRKANFISYEGPNPTKPKRGTDLDAEFDDIERVLSGIQARAAEVQRDDGKLANGAVHMESLDPVMIALLATRGGSPRGPWSPNEDYQARDVVEFSGQGFMAVTTHTSSGDFDDDRAAGLWVPVAGEVNLRSNLADPTGGAGLVAYESGTVRSFLDQIQDAGANLLGFYPAGTGLRRSVASRLDETIYATDFVSDPDSVTDWHPAIQAAMGKAAASGSPLVLPPGTLLLSDLVSVSQPAAGFSMRGAGKGVTILKRNGPGRPVLAFNRCSHITAGGFSVDGSYDTMPEDGSHGISINRCDDITIHDVSVYNYKDSGIINVTPSDGIVRERVVLINCDVDGWDNANNGIALSTLRLSGMINCNVMRLGKTGAPCYALQFKNICDRNFIIGGSAEGASAGVAFGQEVGSTAVTNTVVTNVRVSNCSMGVLIGYAENNVFNDIWIDMSGRDGLPQGSRAISLAWSHRNTFRATIKNPVKETYPPIRCVEGSSYNTFDIPLFIDDAGLNTAFIRLESGSNNNVCVVHNKTNGYPASKSTHKQQPGGYDNLFYYANRPRVGPSYTISNGTIPTPPLDSDFIRLDTEDSAATDTLDSIGAGADGQLITISTSNPNRDITVSTGTGNIWLINSSFTLDQPRDRLTLMFDAVTDGWVEVSRANN